MKKYKLPFTTAAFMILFSFASPFPTHASRDCIEEMRCIERIFDGKRNPPLLMIRTSHGVHIKKEFPPHTIYRCPNTRRDFVDMFPGGSLARRKENLSSSLTYILGKPKKDKSIKISCYLEDPIPRYTAFHLHEGDTTETRRHRGNITKTVERLGKSIEGRFGGPHYLKTETPPQMSLADLHRAGWLR